MAARARRTAAGPDGFGARGGAALRFLAATIRARAVVEVGTGYGNAHDLAFTDAGTLLVAGTATLHEVTLDGLTEVGRQVREDERLVPVLLPLGAGLLCATRL